jgi:aminoglycoside phosphotransferase (APT) family kinase protein
VLQVAYAVTAIGSAGLKRRVLVSEEAVSLTTDGRDYSAEAITPSLVQRLLAAQFPQWADLPVTPAEPQGWDNRTFRLGTTLSVRLPSAEGYTPQVAKEQRWLPYLAPQLPLPIPAPVAFGAPGEGFPWPWSIYRWLDGETASVERIADLNLFAETLAHFLIALQQVEPAGGPPAGAHSFFRGGPLETYDAEARRSILALDGVLDTAAATAVWESGLASSFQGPPVWFHGDVAVNNLLVVGGWLSAVIDFGCCGVGDPACDLAIAWTLFAGVSRERFRATLQVDDDTWARGRGWALWKALITLVEYRASDQLKAAEARRVLGEVLAE